jgi:lipoate-protein ligase A
MHKEGATLFLWQNDNCVVIGRNQNAIAECNLEYLKENDIKLSRRYSGGGAVFHDLGNINYTLVMKESLYDLSYAKEFLYDALKSIGFDVEFSGRNDITIDGAKFSGQAYFFHQNMHVLHGTLMFDLNIGALGKCLTPPKKKLESKGIKSVKSRVVNLKQIKPDIKVEQIKEAMIRSFIKFYGESNPLVEVTDQMIDQELTTYLMSDEWLLGKTPAFDVEIQEKLSFGNVLLRLTIKNNLIKSAEFFTDSLETNWEGVNKALVGLPFDEEKIWKLLEGFYSNK